MKPPFFSSRPWLPALLLGLALAGTAQAEKADRNKPMNIEADALRHDDLRQVSIFTGRVVITKGSITVRGARVEVRQDPEGYQYGVITAEPGKRAFYRQKREGVEEFIEGEAEVVEFDGKADTVKLLRRAELRRFKGTHLNDELAGALIVYDNTTDVFTVDGSAQGGAASGGGRIKAMLTPNLSTANGTGTVAPAATLRPSGNLGGERK